MMHIDSAPTSFFVVSGILSLLAFFSLPGVFLLARYSQPPPKVRIQRSDYYAPSISLVLSAIGLVALFVMCVMFGLPQAVRWVVDLLQGPGVIARITGVMMVLTVLLLAAEAYFTARWLIRYRPSTRTV